MIKKRSHFWVKNNFFFFFLWKDCAILSTAQLYKLQILSLYTKPALPFKMHLLYPSSFQFLMSRSIFSMPLPPRKPALFSTQAQPSWFSRGANSSEGNFQKEPHHLPQSCCRAPKNCESVSWYTYLPQREWEKEILKILRLPELLIFWIIPNFRDSLSNLHSIIGSVRKNLCISMDIPKQSCDFRCLLLKKFLPSQ